MESQDKLFEDFRAAAASDEQNAFLGQDKLWSKIEQQLDAPQKETKKISFWQFKYVAAVAVGILGLGLIMNAIRFDASKAPKDNISQVETNISQKAPASKTEQQVNVLQSTHSSNERIASVVENHKTEATTSVQLLVNEDALPVIKITSYNEAAPQSIVIDRPRVTPLYELKAKDQTILPAKTQQIIEPISYARKVNGKIYDKSGKVIAGAKVSVLGMDLVAITDNNGLFEINIPSNVVQLEINALDNEPDVIWLGNTNYYEVEVSPNKRNVAILKDIRKHSNTQTDGFSGALSNTTPQQVVAKPKLNGTDAFNKISNLMLADANGGQPTAKSDIKLQAAASENTNTPLIVVDGAPYAGNLGSIKPKDIKETKILPESTAKALYGARAKYGVILITMKKGKTVDNPKIKKAETSK